MDLVASLKPRTTCAWHPPPGNTCTPFGQPAPPIKVAPRPPSPQLHRDAGALMTLALLQTAARAPMGSADARKHRPPRLPLLGGMLHCEPCQLVRLLGTELPHGCRPHRRIGHLRQRHPPAGKPRDDGRDAARVLRLQPGTDGLHRLLPLSRLYRRLQLPLGGMDRDESLPHAAQCITRRSGGLDDTPVGGLSFFRGSLARPFQGSRYRSRSQSLPRSRSFQ